MLESNLSGDYSHAIAQEVNSRFRPLRTRFNPRSDNVGYVVVKVALGTVFSWCFDFPCQLSFDKLLHIH
jgi:hypothetical protein